MHEEISENDSRRIQLDIWLSQHRMSKKELSSLLGVSESAVYGWFSNTKIPQKRWLQMQDYFCKNSEQPTPGCIAVEVSFTEDEWERMTESLPVGTDKVEYMRTRMMNLIKAARLPES